MTSKSSTKDTIRYSYLAVELQALRCCAATSEVENLRSCDLRTVDQALLSASVDFVGAGVFPKEQSEREESAFIPKGADWIQDYVAELQPEQNAVVTRSGRRITYDYLVIALGIQIDWNKIRDCKKALVGNRSAATIPISKSTIRGNA